MQGKGEQTPNQSNRTFEPEHLIKASFLLLPRLKAGIWKIRKPPRICEIPALVEVSKTKIPVMGHRLWVTGGEEPSRDL